MTNVTEVGVFSNFQTGASFTDYTVFSTNSAISSAAAANTVNLGNFAALVGDNNPTDMNSFRGVFSGGTFRNGSRTDSYEAYAAGGTFETGSDVDSVNMFSNFPVIDVVAMQNYSTFNSSPNLGANSATAIQNLNDANFNPSLGANLVVDNFNGIIQRPNVTAGATVNNNYVGIDVGINGPVAVTGGVTGININMDNFVTNSQKQGLAINNGSLSVNSLVNSNDPWFGAAAGGNYLGGTFGIVNGSPVAGGEFVFGNNLAFQIVADDDMGPDFTGLGIGYSVVGFVGQASVTAGHTVDTVNLAGAGVGIPPTSTGGTITDLTFYRAIGALPSGGTINVTNLYGFRAGAGLTTVTPTNVWGISIENADAENFFEKSLAINTTTKKVSSSSVGLEIGNGKSAIVEGYIGTKTLLRLEDPDAGVNEIDIAAPTTLATNYTLTLPVDDGLSGQALTTNGSGVLSWSTVATGDVVGPASSVNSEIVLFDGATGKLVKAATGSGFVKATSGVYSTAASVDLSTDVTGTLPFNSVGYESVVTKTTTATLVLTESTILADATGGSFTITLPTAVGNTGKVYKLKKTNASNAVTIDGNGAQTIDGYADIDMVALNDEITIISDGTNWQVTDWGIVVALRVGATSSNFNTTEATQVYGTVTTDTHNGYSAGTYTVVYSGFYEIVAQGAPGGTLTTTQNAVLKIRINGSTVAQNAVNGNGANTNVYPHISDKRFLFAGDTVDVRGIASAALTNANSTVTDIFALVMVGR